jgi:multidrug resistance efflux pump
MQKAFVAVGVVVVVSLGLSYAFVWSRPQTLVLTGIVTTNDVIVSPQIAGQIGKLLVTEGDVVAKDQLLAVIVPDELKADRNYYLYSAEGMVAQVQQSQAALRYQEKQTADQIKQAEATLASTVAQQAEAAADLEKDRLALERNQELVKQGVVSAQDFDQARTTYEGARAHVESLKKQVDAQQAALALAQSNAEQVLVKRSELETNERQRAAADAQKVKADVRLNYTELKAPIPGIVDVRPVRIGEYVNAGQPVVTLINPDDLWVRADVEETYIDSVRLGDHLMVRLPSGEKREGTVFFRGVDGAFATQRDVSRTKRDIKTFEVRLRVDNSDRRLAVGMTVYVLYPVSR